MEQIGGNGTPYRLAIFAISVQSNAVWCNTNMHFIHLYSLMLVYVSIMSGWPSGLRRYVQVVVYSVGVGSNPTPDIIFWWCDIPSYHNNLFFDTFMLDEISYQTFGIELNIFQPIQPMSNYVLFIICINEQAKIYWINLQISKIFCVFFKQIEPFISRNLRENHVH